MIHRRRHPSIILYKFSFNLSKMATATVVTNIIGYTYFIMIFKHPHLVYFYKMYINKVLIGEVKITECRCTRYLTTSTCYKIIQTTRITCKLIYHSVPFRFCFNLSSFQLACECAYESVHIICTFLRSMIKVG